MLYLTIVGSRKASQLTLETIATIALRARTYGITTRTGDAIGVDHSCRSFQNYKSFNSPTLVNSKHNTAFHIAHTEVYSYHDYANSDSETRLFLENKVSKYHGAWNRCSAYAKGLHCRNTFQLTGLNPIEPVLSFAVLCWTPDGCEHHFDRSISTGGTGTAISLASMEYNIPVFNIQREGRLQEFYEFMRKFIIDHGLKS